jgi:hypothetical protein
MAPRGRATFVATEVFQAIDVWPMLFVQNTLGRHQYIWSILELPICMLYLDLLLAIIFMPHSLGNTVIEFQIPIKMPFLNRGLDVRLDIGACRIESLPVWLGVEGECL